MYHSSHYVFTALHCNDYQHHDDYYLFHHSGDPALPQVEVLQYWFHLCKWSVKIDFGKLVEYNEPI